MLKFDREVSVVVLRSTVPGIFCAGLYCFFCKHTHMYIACLSTYLFFQCVVIVVLVWLYFRCGLEGTTEYDWVRSRTVCSKPPATVHRPCWPANPNDCSTGWCSTWWRSGISTQLWYESRWSVVIFWQTSCSCCWCYFCSYCFLSSSSQDLWQLVTVDVMQGN